MAKRRESSTNSSLTKEGLYPLKTYEDLSTFKIYYSDVGLLTLKGSLSPLRIIQNIDISDKTRGLLAESYVASQLVALNHSLHYWCNNNTPEVDFIIQINDQVIPVEVKSSNNTKAKSLRIYINKYKPEYSIKISSKNFGFENKIKNIPLYAVFCLKQ